MKQNFLIMYLLIAGAQLLVCNYFHISSYIVLSLLPAAVFFLPTGIGTAAAMFIAFATGLSVDLLAEGVLGLNALALVPVAASRRFLRDAVFGKELSVSGEDISMRKYGVGKVSFAMMVSQAVFLIIYLWADGAPARPALFNVLRFLSSLVAGTLVSLAIAHLLDPNERK